MTWHDKAKVADFMDESNLVRRVQGIHEIRFDGFSDLLLRARGASVLDIGCNRGHIGWEFAVNGARLVHGCDIDAPSVQCANMWFSENPNVESKFVVVDLRGGAKAVQDAFGVKQYDIVLFLGVYHKIKRVMIATDLDDLTLKLANRASTYFCWTGYAEDLAPVNAAASSVGLTLVHKSELALPDRPAAIWKRR